MGGGADCCAASGCAVASQPVADSLVLFVLPGWAILGGLAIVILMDLLSRALARLARRAGPSKAPGLLITATSYGVGVLVLVGFLASQFDTIRAVRTPAGHGEAFGRLWRPRTGRNTRSCRLSFRRPTTAQIAAYARSDEQRLVGVHLQRDLPTIWPQIDPPSKRRQYLRQHERVVLLLKGASTGACEWRPRRSAEIYVSRCLPSPLRDMPYQVEFAEAIGQEWTFAVLTYHPDKSDP